MDMKIKDKLKNVEMTVVVKNKLKKKFAFPRSYRNIYE